MSADEVNTLPPDSKSNPVRDLRCRILRSSSLWNSLEIRESSRLLGCNWPESDPPEDTNLLCAWSPIAVPLSPTLVQSDKLVSYVRTVRMFDATENLDSSIS